MKKSSVFLFIIGFAAAYLYLCYCVPGLRLKLVADPVTYFKESIRYAAVFKTVASCIVGTVFAVLPNVMKRALRSKR